MLQQTGWHIEPTAANQDQMQPKPTHQPLQCQSHESRPVRRRLPCVWIWRRRGGYGMRKHRRRGPVESPRGCGGELSGRKVVDEGAVDDPRGALRGGHGGAAGKRGPRARLAGGGGGS
jgi:hypothetical protein